MQKNQTTKIIATTVGILLAIAGFEHGLFEVFQGNAPTNKLIIQAIGKDMQWWIHGSEEAFTLIPNFLITGICAMCVSLFIIFWSVFRIDKKHGTTVFILLFILLVLVGGGMGFIPFFIATWAYATRINKPLKWWKRLFGDNTRKIVAVFWPYTLTLTIICWLLALELAVFGYFPGMTDPESLLSLCWSFLLATFILINLSFISGFASDVKR